MLSKAQTLRAVIKIRYTEFPLCSHQVMLLSNNIFGIPNKCDFNMLRESKVSNKLGKKIRQLRKNQGLTLEQLAKKANNMSKSYLWELENRESQSNPSAEKLNFIADALGVATAYFLEEDVREPEEKHLDEAFFRGYKNLEQNDKEQLRKILDAFKKE